MRFRLLIALLALALVAAACGGSGPKRDASGQVLEPARVSVFDLRLGDCFDDESTQADQVATVPVVPCRLPHDNEIYHSFESTLGAFPGIDEMRSGSADICYENFPAFVGIAWEDSEFDLFPITPTEESWQQGDRTVLCALYQMDLEQMTGSMRGAGR